ncbi:MAG: TRAP transporter small permease subunit [Hyphomicrobiales bacterium]|nr:TRAP transporter small permease subunit [Hyphomicrobiales bacterium]
MLAALRISKAIDGLNTALGRSAAWLILLAVIISAVNAIVRKAFDSSSNVWLEMQWYLFGAVFLTCAAWTLIANEHIRIDIVSNLYSRRTRSRIELFGHLFFLLPMTIVMIVTTYPFFVRSFLENEQSSNAGGLPLYPAKFLILLGFVLLFLQAVSEIIKRVAMMRGVIEERVGGGHHDMAEAEAQRLKEALEAEAAKKLEDAANAARISKAPQ